MLERAVCSLMTYASLFFVTLTWEWEIKEKVRVRKENIWECTEKMGNEFSRLATNPSPRWSESASRSILRRTVPGRSCPVERAALHFASHRRPRWEWWGGRRAGTSDCRSTTACNSAAGHQAKCDHENAMAYLIFHFHHQIDCIMFVQFQSFAHFYNLAMLSRA